MTESDTKKYSETVITKMPSVKLVESNVCKKALLARLTLVEFTETLKATILVTLERLNQVTFHQNFH